uniref:Uncharacterized protein n=1 Tax=Glossina palpalis gambiensis TaxID=67801 RepID=A0A1B0B4K6_9MUSC
MKGCRAMNASTYAYVSMHVITSTSQCLTDMAEGCEEAESNSNNRNADNAPTMLGTVLPCEAAITASLGVSGGGVMKREFVDAASSILGSSLAAAAHLTASVSLASPTSSMASPTTLSNTTITPSTTAPIAATSITQQQQHQQRLTPTPKTSAALGPLVCSTTLSSLSSSSSSSSSSSASSNSSTSSSLSSLNSSTTASSSTTAAIATNSNTNKSPSVSPYSSVVAVASLRGISPHSPTVLTSMGPSPPIGHNSNGSCGSVSANVTTTTPAVPSNCNSQSPVHVTLNIKTEANIRL